MTGSTRRRRSTRQWVAVLIVVASLASAVLPLPVVGDKDLTEEEIAEAIAAAQRRHADDATQELHAARHRTTPQIEAMRGELAVGHRVRRGPDWKWGDQDGGKGHKGTVVELRAWRGEVDRKKYGARVRWDHGGVNTYRWGAEGARDLEVVGAVDEDIAVAFRPEKPTIPKCDARDRAALLEIYESAEGESWPRTAQVGWKEAAGGKGPDEADPCIDEWQGVLCEKGRVVALDLSNNGITTPFPDAIAQLTRLKTLRLSQNRLTGTLPDALGRISSMRWLSISDNMLEGTLPATLSSMTRLEWFAAYNNRFSGELPEVFATMSSLSELQLQNNYLTGTISPMFGSMPNLKSLLLKGNNLRGTLPESLAFGKVKHLTVPPTVYVPRRIGNDDAVDL